MSDFFLGEVRMFGGNFAPRFWAFCDGQLLSIAQYSALFSLIGTTYGGDGRTTFALPDLRGRVPMSQGQGAGLSARVIGERSGTETVTLISTQLPAHSHALNATTAQGSLTGPGPTALLGTPAGANSIFYAVPGTSSVNPVPMAQTSVGLDGGNQGHSNLMPTLCISFIIALQGIFPSRN